MTTALVIGGTSGVGLAVARQLAGRGHTVHIAGRNTGRLDRATAAIDGDVHGHVLDAGPGGVTPDGPPFAATFAYQPIFDIAAGEIYAYEALVGGRGGEAASPAGKIRVIPLHSAGEAGSFRDVAQLSQREPRSRLLDLDPHRQNRVRRWRGVDIHHNLGKQIDLLQSSPAIPERGR